VSGIVNEAIARAIERRGRLIRADASCAAQEPAQYDPSHGTTSQTQSMRRSRRALKS
jgi:hypothetical protein